MQIKTLRRYLIQYQKLKRLTIDGVEKLELSYTVSGNAEWNNNLEKHQGSFLEIGAIPTL